jgi:hypothetical protein
MGKRLLERCSRRTLILAAVLTGTVLATTAATAAVSSVIDSSGTIFGCYATSSGNGLHTLYLLDVGTSCPKNTTAIQWNQTGPQGPIGATGPQGATGDTGPQGPVGPSTAGSAGLDVQHVFAAGTGSARATCPADHPYVLGGGGEVNGVGALLVSQGFFSTLPYSWEVASTDPTTPVVAVAICSK